MDTLNLMDFPSKFHGDLAGPRFIGIGRTFLDLFDRKWRRRFFAVAQGVVGYP